MGKALDITGLRSGRLVAVRIADGNYQTSGVHWLCRCDCGSDVVVVASHLRRQHTRSCGCLFREVRARGGRLSHGASRTREYKIWQAMKRRCSAKSGKNFRNYVARGIRVCPEWNDPHTGFQAFIAHIGPRPSESMSVDRIDNARGYEPGNVRWATAKEQNRNYRRNVWVEHGGERLLRSEWAKRSGLRDGCVRSRIARGWDIKRALGLTAN